MTYTYKIQYTSHEEAPQWTFTSNKKYTQQDLKQILHDTIIEFVNNNTAINRFNWEDLLYTYGGNNPILKILEEKHNLTICEPTYTATLTYWGWSHISTEDTKPGFEEHTPLRQQEINNELAKIFQKRNPTPYIDGIFYQKDDD